MPYVERDEAGNVAAIFANPQPGYAEEWLDTVPPRPLTQADFAAAVQDHLDAKAREREYDSLLTAVTYRNDPNAQYAAEAAALIEWRSDVWTYATAELAKVQNGTRPTPTVAEFIAELPGFVWP